MKKYVIWDKFDKLFSPILSVWFILIYLHLLQCIYLWEIVNSKILISVLFIPIVFLEFWATNRFFYKNRDLSSLQSKWKLYLSFFGNLLFWLICFLIWVIFIGFAKEKAPGIKFYGPQIYIFVILLWRSMPWFTFINIILWLSIYYILTIRWYRFRIFTSVICPITLTFMLFFYQFLYGGVGTIKSTIIMEQIGVKKILDIDELRNAISTAKQSQTLDGGYRKDSMQIEYQARGIIKDETADVIIAFFGCTYCSRCSVKPIVVRKELTTGNIQYLLSRNNLRQIENLDTTIFIAPWREKYIYEVSKTDLTVVRKISSQVSRENLYWEPMSILKDVSKDYIYVANEIYPAILSYNLSTGKLRGILDLQKSGLICEGGTAHTMVQSRKTRKIYFIGLPGDNDLFELDPDNLQITRTLDLGDVFGTALIIDDENGYLYYQSGFYNSLYQIDIEKFKKERKYKGEYHARRICLDKRRNVIYVLGYTSGTVFPVDLISGKNLWKVKVGGRAHGMYFSNDTLWVHSMAGAFRLDLKTIWKDQGYSGTRFDITD